jgi:hypothetical protein
LQIFDSGSSLVSVIQRMNFYITRNQFLKNSKCVLLIQSVFHIYTSFCITLQDEYLSSVEATLKSIRARSGKYAEAKNLLTSPSVSGEFIHFFTYWNGLSRTFCIEKYIILTFEMLNAWLLEAGTDSNIDWQKNVYDRVILLTWFVKFS